MADTDSVHDMAVWVNWYYAYDIVVVGADVVVSVVDYYWAVSVVDSAHSVVADTVADYCWAVSAVDSVRFVRAVAVVDFVRFVQAVSDFLEQVESARYRAYSFGIPLPCSFSLTSSLHHMKRRIKKYCLKKEKQHGYCHAVSSFAYCWFG